jgi:hypothetical protein
MAADKKAPKGHRKIVYDLSDGHILELNGIFYAVELGKDFRVCYRFAHGHLDTARQI